jgi:ComF family protein
MVTLSKIIHAILDFCFPWSCAVCKTPFEGQGPLCNACHTTLNEMEAEPHCPACALSLPLHGNPCPYCMGKAPPNFTRIVRLTAFHDPTRILIHHLKYHKRWTLGEELAQRLSRHRRVEDLVESTDLLIPVPLHWRRQLPRGYNQAEVIARRLGKIFRKPVLRAVRRIRHTEMQTHLHSHAKRAENLRDAFALTTRQNLAGKHLTLIDDVWTTGATMQAMARVLKTAKPASLSAIVLATADPRGLERTKHDELKPELELDY